MKRKLYVSFLLCFFSVQMMAQGQYDSASSLMNYDEEVAEGLVSFALEGPSIKSAEDVSAYYEYSYTRSRTAWLNNISVAGNLNEFSLKQTAGSQQLQQNTLYPRYNIGVVLPLGTFVNNRKQSQADYYRFKATEEDVEVARRKMRRDVLTAYQAYLLQQRLLSLQYAVLKDAELLFMRTESKFSKGEITIEAYTTASKSFTEEKIKVANVERALRVASADLEELIGMTPQVAIMQIRARQQSQPRQ